MANKTVTVRPSGGDYTSFQAAITGEVSANANLVTMEGILTISIEDDWSGGPDTTAVVLTGFITSADYYVKVVTDSANRASKSGIDSSKYILQMDDTRDFRVQQDYTVIDGLQLDCTTAGFCYETNTANTGIVVKNCYARYQGGGSGFVTSTTSASVKFENCISFNGGTPRASSSQGFYAINGTMVIYNCVAAYADDGVERDGGTVTVVNSAVFESTDDFDGTITISYCASDDGDGSNPVTPSGGAWTNEFSDPANGNFTLLNSGNLYDSGIGPSSDANVPATDIDGDARAGTTCDIGVDEYTAGSGADLEGSVSATSTVSGALSVGKPLAGEVSASSAASGALSVSKPLAGAIAAASTVAGALSVGKFLSGTVAAESSAAATISVEKPLAGNVTATSSACGELSGSASLSGSVSASSAASGSLSVGKPLSGLVSAVSTASGTLAGSADLSGSIIATSSASGSLSVGKPLSGSVHAESSTSGELTETGLSGNVQATSSASGSLSVGKLLAGAVVSISLVSGTLTIGTAVSYTARIQITAKIQHLAIDGYAPHVSITAKPQKIAIEAR